MANREYYYGTGKDSGLAEWGLNTNDFKAGSITDAYNDGGYLGVGTNYNGVGGVGANATPSFGAQAKGFGSDLFGAGGAGGGLMESLGGFGGVMGGLASLADTWMNYSALKAQKNSARDAHNASAQQVNNNRARSASVGKSVFGGGYKQTGKDIASSTV